MDDQIHLYVGPMDATLVAFDNEGHVRFDGEPWTTPTLQERRAILYAAEQQCAAIQELIEAQDRASRPSREPA